MKTTIIDLKNEALNQHVPIISDDGLLFLLNAIKEYQVKTVLEIGCAVGYSAIQMALVGTLVTTIERDEEMKNKALINIDKMGLTDKITVVYRDALDETLVFDQKFDMIFIDAAKAQYGAFFNKYEPYLSDTGIIVTDNLNFHNLNPNKVSRSTKRLISRLNDFKLDLGLNENFKTSFSDIGDGMSISRRQKNEKNSNTI
ncbi:MAG TPA: methyltransferase domain-containing protein [Acholeplasma sp.]|nr:methyltransferase domain-containing protein [Acholeplasma sp.]